ncbi:free fatty acid receptor 3 [Salmo salar]|uniref:Free fatty acid receptor 3 n=1 Tax=Salmo salar TaxID=8030 RepID=A0A1S3PXV6_SALSA|nr:free fatty acid receptor 3-like [Salmo salar]|eukprot:XP_014032532.1 PREDICTED: free fatty acid receptor 3-like [Salmo salar]
MVTTEAKAFFVTTMLTVPANMRPADDISCSFALFVYITTFLIGVPANILAFCTFCQKVRRKPAPIDILLLNLTISDLIFLAFLPFKMKEAVDDMNWNLPYFLCPVTGFLFFSTIYNSTLLLTAVSVERFLSVAYPVRFTAPGRVVHAQLACVVFWILSVAHCSVVFVMQLDKDADNTTCYGNFSDVQLITLLPVRLEMSLVLFCVPFLISTFCYVNFIRILSRLPNISQHRRLRAIGLALGTLLVFALCFGPYNVSHMVGIMQNKVPTWRNNAILLTTLNACLDPIIFYFSSSDVRSTLSLCLKRIKAKLNPKATAAHAGTTPDPMDSTHSSSQRFVAAAKSGTNYTPR